MVVVVVVAVEVGVVATTMMESVVVAAVVVETLVDIVVGVASYRQQWIQHCMTDTVVVVAIVVVAAAAVVRRSFWLNFPQYRTNNYRLDLDLKNYLVHLSLFFSLPISLFVPFFSVQSYINKHQYTYFLQQSGIESRPIFNHARANDNS
jgi:hypothetical protein